ncbi:30S ribosomal protein S6 [Sulfurovum sp.]|uniref:30S ribosomal protein S6 n=1 Tax=Sulfurovum sp. TaxID=1969726 RepID=UPI002867B72F|nr:30S ribosomal protein S6 [Sulfurovum sp.]
MTCYETLFVVKPTLTEEEIATQITKVKDVLVKEGAELVGINDMGMRKLAYPVEKHARGYYTVLFYKAAGTTIEELERNIKNNEDIIKFLTVKYSKNKEIVQFDKLVASANKKAAPEAKAPEVAVEEVEEVEEVVVEAPEVAEVVVEKA